ncbi:MAG: ABC transporter permease [Rhizobiales bacterium]|nr:ABC transporter permease [Hyphomicrobiales bacterium]
MALPAFRDPANLANVVRQAGVLGILAIGQTFVISAGMLDLSIGAITGLVVVLSSALLNGDAALTLPVVALMVAVGAVIGMLNGVLLNTLRLHPLILTFGMLSVLQGAIFSFTDKSVGRTSAPLAMLANGDIAGVPWSALLLLVLAIGGHLLLAHTRFGYHLMAAGGNPESARRAGINIERIRFAVFVISGVTAALAGLLLAGRLGTGYPLAGNGLELDAIVAVVLGGTLLSGGRGSIWRSLAGVLMLAVLSNTLNLMNVSAFVQMFVKGLVVIGAILLNQPRRASS